MGVGPQSIDLPTSVELDMSGDAPLGSVLTKTSNGVELVDDGDLKGNSLAAQAGLSGGSVTGGALTASEDGNTTQIEADGLVTVNTQEFNLTDLAAARELSGQLYVPPAYMQTSGDTTFALTSANHKIGVRFVPEVDMNLNGKLLSWYLTAISAGGNVGISICDDSTAYEPNGRLNGSTTNVAPTMTANNAPSPYVVGIFDKDGNNAEVASFEAFLAMDGSASGNGCKTTSLATAGPFYYCINIPAGIRLNKFKFYSAGDAFPKAFTVWMSSAENPTKHTDADWTQLTGASAWTAETDPGTGNAREYYVNNATSPTWIRFKITDRTGASDFVRLLYVELFAAQLQSAPGSELHSYGNLDTTGASADTWLQKTLDDYQLQREKAYWLVLTGSASLNVSASLRRWNTAQGSAFPDGAVCKTSSDGTAWTQALQDSKPAMMNFILGATSHNTPYLIYGRKKGVQEYLYGVGLIDIPEGGIWKDCEAYTASVDYANQYPYWLYLFNNNGVLDLNCDDTNLPTTHGTNGIKCKTGSLGYRFVGLACFKNLISTYQGPIDVMDCSWVAWKGRQRFIGKPNPYAGLTQQAINPALWEEWGLGVFKISVLCLEDSEISIVATPGDNSNAATRETTIFIDGVRVIDHVQWRFANNMTSETITLKQKLTKGLHSIIPASRPQSTSAVNINHWRAYHADGLCGTASIFEGDLKC